ncbi:spore germination protein [Fictibacillus fluitans]|uniref:Spore germination protein n=1 Tax=Fictibacillus fluitans TaxID=3058422 RepID=A0ABT8HQ69_9BACL|nr:spore germination protein [Fictibacillus sp. NE201]MDN4522904.1 spore germination protein [Fictibacillus sp. NE201]
MSATVGSINIKIIQQSAVLNFGDARVIQPKRSEKSYTGSGFGNTGNNIATETYYSETRTFDNDLVDENGNNNE